MGDLTELRFENLEMEAVADDVSNEETKCVRVASPAGECSGEEEVLDLTAEPKRELRVLALEAGIWGLWEGGDWRWGWRVCVSLLFVTFCYLLLYQTLPASQLFN